MDERIFQVLEFNKIINLLSAQAATSLGKELAFELKPSTSMDEVVQKQNETDEAAQIIRLNKTIPLGGIADIRASLKRSVIGGILSTNECLDVANTIYGGRMVKDFIEKLEEELPILTSLAASLSPLRDLEQRIKRCIDDHGNVLDSASEKLRGIRSSVRTLENRVREKLDSITKTKAKMLSDAIITIRNDRYVLPVRQEYRGSIGGIVHDQSTSGQTLFMEPKVVVDLNNQLHEAQYKEKQEIERILASLSEHIANEEIYLTENIRILGTIDFIFARAKLGQQMKASKPQINDQGIIKMQQARHPLIPIDKVVANDIEIGTDYTSIVITGPNTGGKTVTLKMIGLCTLMAQAGLQIPALDGCELAVFDHVFADIGDEQSIEQNLSTFSSHMTNIVNIMKRVNHKSLVLFDELGAGTDPQEGAALAMAILDDVVSRGARVIATTHYPELKAYGYNRNNVINASVEFDVETLQPTYRLLIGIPGRSNAFEISKKLGLDDAIIGKAKSLVGRDSKNVENMIVSLERSQLKAKKDYEQAHRVLLESENLLADLQKEWNAFHKKRGELFEKAEEKADKAIQKAREEAEAIVATIRKMKTNAEMKEHEWIDAKKALENAHPELVAKDKKVQTTTTENVAFLPGDDVKLISLNQQGTIIEKVNENEYLVQAGIMKVKVKQNDLQFIGKQKTSNTEPLSMIKGSQYHVRPELDLRGERFEDAILKVEKYIDDALLAGYSKVSIIHGKGTGALRKGVQEYAKRHPAIASYRQGAVGEGGSGVTVIEFK